MNLDNQKIVSDRKAILSYLFKKNPNALFKAVAMSRSSGMGEAVSSTESTLNQVAESETWFDKALKALTLYNTAVNQRDIAKINLKLIEQGKEPLSTDVTGTAINLGIAAETRKVLVYTAVGLGGLLALVLLMKKR